MRTTYRHKLKTNEVASLIDRTVDTMMIHRRRVFAGLGLAVVLGAVIGGVMYRRSRTEAAVGALLGDASVILSAQVVPPPAPGQPETPGSYPSERAKLEAALETYLAAADGYPNTTAGISARYRAQAAHYDEAIAALQDLSATPREDLPQDAMLMELGRVYLMAGRTAEAQQTFQRLLDEFPNSQFAAEARREVDVIKVNS
jgi:tetratricopeptide (TPR) repeat protein